MPAYVWQHELKGEPERLRMMSDVLDPASRGHLERIGVVEGWRCLEIGAGNGSLSQWLAKRVGPTGKVIASDINVDLMRGIATDNLDVCRLDVVKDEAPGAPFDLSSCGRYCITFRSGARWFRDSLAETRWLRHARGT